MVIKRVQKSYNKNPQRRKMVSGPSAAANITVRTPIQIVSVVTATDTFVVTYNQPVVYAGVPQYTAGGLGEPVSAAHTSPAVVTLTYPSSTADLTMVVPFEDPFIRNSVAGYVLAGTYPST